MPSLFGGDFYRNAAVIRSPAYSLCPELALVTAGTHEHRRFLNDPLPRQSHHIQCTQGSSSLFPSSLPAHLDIFLNPAPQPNPNILALSRIVPPPMPRHFRPKAILRLERMQGELSSTHINGPQPVRFRLGGSHDETQTI